MLGLIHYRRQWSGLYWGHFNSSLLGGESDSSSVPIIKLAVKNDRLWLRMHLLKNESQIHSFKSYICNDNVNPNDY